MYSRKRIPNGTIPGSNSPVELSIIPDPFHWPPLTLILNIKGDALEQIKVSKSIGFG